MNSAYEAAIMAVNLLLVQYGQRRGWPLAAHLTVMSLSILVCLAVPAEPGLAPALGVLLQGILALAMLRTLALHLPVIPQDGILIEPFCDGPTALHLNAPHTDTLTGLADNDGFEACLAAWCGRAAGEQTSLGLILLEVDQFSTYTDYYGFHAGDACLQTVALTLREQLRTTGDFLARLPEGTFAVILPGVSVHACADIAERLRSAIAASELPNLGDSHQAMISVSAGVASQVPAHANAAGGLIAAAQTALHAAKTGGRNQVLMSVPGVAQSSKEAVLF